jgi:subfamily B ATP-binding cassette protein MsbA
MNSFRRVFKYIWPQWLRVVTVFMSAFIVALLLLFSFASVVPLLKIMIGEEGLHGWIDRNVCDWRYGVDFYVPETVDFTDGNDPDISFYLRVRKVDEKGLFNRSLAYESGLRSDDRIIGVGSQLVRQGNDRVLRSKLLQELAEVESESVVLQLNRSNQAGFLEPLELTLAVPEKTFGVKFVQNLGRFVKRGHSKAEKLRAVTFIIIALIIITIIRCLMTYYQKYTGEKIVQIANANLREDMIVHIMDMPMEFFTRYGTSDTISRIVRDVNQTAEGAKLLLGKALREPMNALCLLGGAFYLSWKLTLLFVASAPVAIGIGVLLGRKIKKATKRSLIISAQMLGKLEDIIGALKVVKVYNYQEAEKNAYHRVNKKYLKRSLRVTKVDVSTAPILEVLGMFAGSAALLLGVNWVVNANMQASSFFLLLIMLGAAAESIRKSSDIWNKIQMSNAAAERVFALLDESLEKESPDAVELAPLKREIEFRNLVFTYPGSHRSGPVLNKINLKIQAGHNIAIVGPNGSGKTTLANLIPRFYDPGSGQVLIDGTDIKSVTLRSLRQQIGMVTQEVVTFNDTIAANIAYGKPDATREQIIEAAKAAYAHEFIAPLPDAYDTVIGEHGSGLSGGQLQRVVIARAILKNPAILIFDEATSQVDADSEAKIHNAIEQMMQHRTSFIIAHRFSTVITADLIVVMDNGQIIAQGQHEELIRTCLLYQNLYENQLIAS